MHPDEAAAGSLDRISEAYGITTDEHRDALQRAYSVFRQHHGPFITALAAEILDGLQADVTAGHRVVFLGRDGHCLATAVRALDPQLFAEHCHELVLSRTLIDAALRDLERHTSREHPGIEDFRMRKSAPEDAIDRSYTRMTTYMRAAGVPVGREDSAVTLVDTSFKGTAQELLAAIYPQTSFQGRYAFFGECPSDPHPGSKEGYALHLPASAVWPGKPDPWLGRPVRFMPDDQALTFVNQEAIASVEHTLNGPMSSPYRFGDGGPEQQPTYLVDDEMHGLNPVLVAPAYQNLKVRDAVRAAALLAVHDAASASAAARDAGQPWREELQRAHQSYVIQVRSWVTYSPDIDPDLKVVLDSMVHRTDRNMINDLAERIRTAELAPSHTRAVWEKFAELTSNDAKQAFLDTLTLDSGANPTAQGSAGRRQQATQAAFNALRPPSGAAHDYPSAGRPANPPQRNPSPPQQQQHQRREGPQRGR